MSTVNEALAEQAYVLLFERPADVAGLHFFSQLLDNGTSYASLIDGMIHSQEFVSKYAGKNTAQTLQEIINHEYNTPVNSPGVDQLAAKIDSGQTTLAQLLAAPGLVTQPSALANKVGEALHFTHRVEELHLENGYSGDAAIAVASQWIHLIGIDRASVSIAEASLDSAIYASVAAHG